jgi:hypothetical protein
MQNNKSRISIQLKLIVRIRSSMKRMINQIELQIFKKVNHIG